MPSAKRIEPKDFTKFIATQFHRGDDLGTMHSHLQVNVEFQKLLERAVKLAPRVKATDLDEVYSEALQIAPKEAAAALASFWAGCGRVSFLPKECKRILIFPLFKKGNASEASNYRPIALLSYLRMLVEKVID